MASEWDSFRTGLKERLLLIAVQGVVLFVLTVGFAFTTTNTLPRQSGRGVTP